MAARQLTNRCINENILTSKSETGVAQVVMYTQALCGYCAAAKRLLKAKDVAYNEINVTMNAGRRREMMDRSGRRSVPQIFIGDRHIGGYDDLVAMDQAGELNLLLGVDD